MIVLLMMETNFFVLYVSKFFIPIFDDRVDYDRNEISLYYV